MKEKESSRDTVVLRVYSQQVVDAVIHVMNYILPTTQAIQSLDVTESGGAMFVIYSSKDVDYNEVPIMYADTHNTTEEQQQRVIHRAYILNAKVVCIHNYEHIVDIVKDYCTLLTNIMSFTQYVDKGIMRIPVDKPLPTRRQLIAKVRKLINETYANVGEQLKAEVRTLVKDYVKEPQPDIHEPVDNTQSDTSIIVLIETDAALVWFKALVEYLDLFTGNFVYDDLGNGIGAARILSTSEAELGIKNDGGVVYSYSERTKYEHPSFNDCERVVLDTGKSFRQFVVDNNVQLRRLSIMCENHNNAEQTSTVKSYTELLEAVDKILEA